MDSGFQLLLLRQRGKAKGLEKGERGQSDKNRSLLFCLFPVLCCVAYLRFLRLSSPKKLCHLHPLRWKSLRFDDSYRHPYCQYFEELTQGTD
ncbi:hypothetical protein L6452_20874 [Arctium lappa]|uniref:Uncharacterized protein n=1 Tax=Arctium lappa TaxID=4217 RepID=A0ACB9BD17_ARCLA|nr:hypothetical protein L6452_20874 [Arctium lappa]